jgi:hypothetical protein
MHNLFILNDLKALQQRPRAPKAPARGQEFASMEPKQGRDAFPKCCCGVLAHGHFR